MSRLLHMRLPALALLLLVALVGRVLQAAQPVATTIASVRPATTAPTRPSTSVSATTQSMGEYGKDVILLDDLVDNYEPVPFAHRRHAQMAEMWNGCETCHHHTPTTAPSAAAPNANTNVPHTQDQASAIPACKSCHPQAPSQAEIEMPTLKGAYHRQCLNCHRDWMGSNACAICHAPREGTAASMPTTQPPSTDDIVGRMHKPLTPPINQKIVARYTPVDGTEVLFRHEEHVKEFGIKCVACHQRDSCADCHKTNPATAATVGATAPAHMLKPAQTWRQSHEPCVSCHEKDRCNQCHYQPGKAPPPPFKHETTGQALDKDHENLACGECHQHYKTAPALACSTGECHKRTVAFPADRPGIFTPPATTAPATTSPTIAAATTQAATRPLIIRIRRGVQ